MARSADRRRKPARGGRGRRASTKRAAARIPHRRGLITRVFKPEEQEGTRETREPAADVPDARIKANGGTVSVEITFGHAQHGKYTIQLFDPSGTTELARATGFSTDQLSDRFDLKLTPAQLDRTFVQWSGAVDAFSSAPGQRFSVIFEVLQNGAAVPGGNVERSGPLNVTQAFLGVLRLVAS